jgi:hypothetical protein
MLPPIRSGLKKSLADLNTFSNSTTRRLDDSYYSILEKLGVLQSTVIALKELAGMSRETNASFEKQSGELVGEISAQLDSFGGFEEQECRIESLKARIDGGRDRIQGLSARVDAVQERIERWERADREWQERTRRRLKVGWVVTSSVVFALVLLFLSAQYFVPQGLEEATARVANESLNYLWNLDQGGTATHGAQPEGVTARSTSSVMTVGYTPSLDDKLRAFDEL